MTQHYDSTKALHRQAAIYIAAGLSNSEIGDIMYASHKTVEHWRQQIRVRHKERTIIAACFDMLMDGSITIDEIKQAKKQCTSQKSR